MQWIQVIIWNLIVEWLKKYVKQIDLYNNKNEDVSKTLETGKYVLNLPTGIFIIQWNNKFGLSIIIEGVKVDYNSISFCDINVYSLNK